MTIALTKKAEIRESHADEKINIAHILFLLSWLLKPVYLWESGSMQISDFVLVLSFLAWIVTRDGWISLDTKELPLLAFILSTLVINVIYAAVLRYVWFLYSTAYYVYNLLVVILIRDFIRNKVFLKALLWASAFNLLTQLAVLFMGVGGYFWNIRFMGTFNDPNQFAFSMFTSFLVVFILSSNFKDQEKHRKKFWVLFVFGLAFFFIFQGGSTGMLLGITSFVVMFVITFINSERTPAFMLLKVLAVMLFVAIVTLSIVSGFSTANIDSSLESNTFLIYRLFEKIGKVEGGGFMALIYERGIDKLFTNPMYLIFGAGEGGYERFPGSVFEVHSTLPGILFYYGIIPFIMLCVWLRKNLKSTSKVLIPAYLALLIESFTLANQRQPVVWVIIVLASLEYSSPKELRKYRIMTSL